ncbi:MAG: SMP-30/gluconolactonase/LRE family protein [Sphaerochaetaceae bacterium]|jgi:gluconolactonase|nr:SMP-30/gluconolactonase/LRE family protein [Sphaerochaetaceae bacterium]MDX9809555.1 SMP-30/gluconolactonase/LRE family protein [Sphaerochaetaceae bacterium]
MKLRMEITSTRIFRDANSSRELEVLATGFRFLEGPAWDERLQRLVFSDIPGNGLYQWKEDEGTSLVRANGFLPNGNTFDKDGNLITCEHGTSRVSMTTTDAEYIVLADSYQGVPLNSPNDVVAADDGSYVFTDPPYGRYDKTGIPRMQELPFQGVYRVRRERKEPILLVDDFDRPNGLCFSLDGKRLFVADTARDHIRVFDINDDGSLSKGCVWAEVVRDAPGVFDGIRMSEDGLLWCTGPGGILVYDELARLLGRLFIPEIAANLAWGGPGGRDLFITATTTLYRICM